MTHDIIGLSDTSIVSAIIASGGSIFGGLFGGVIAFVIARSQFSSDKKRDRNSKIQMYFNLIKSLKIELKHNQKILIVLCQNGENKNAYIKALKSEVWDTVKHNANNFLPEEIFAMIDEQNQEFKEIQEGILPDYKSDEIDFELRLSVTTRIIEKLKIEESKYKNDFSPI